MRDRSSSGEGNQQERAVDWEELLVNYRFQFLKNKK